MFKLHENYEVDRRILKFEYIHHSPAKTSTIITLSSQTFIVIPREDSLISLLNSSLDLNFEVIKKIDKSRNGNGSDIQLFTLGPIALFSNFILTTNSGKHLEVITQAHIVPLKHKLTTSAKDSDDLSIGFDRDRGKRRDESTKNERITGKYHSRIMLKDTFWFCRTSRKSYLWPRLWISNNKKQRLGCYRQSPWYCCCWNKNWSYLLVCTTLDAIHSTVRYIIQTDFK